MVATGFALYQCWCLGYVIRSLRLHTAFRSRCNSSTSRSDNNKSKPSGSLDDSNYRCWLKAVSRTRS